MPNIGYGEAVLVLALAILFFGAKRIPDIAAGFGKAIRMFKAGLKGDEGPPDEAPKP